MKKVMRNVQKGYFLTLPTPARQDAPYPRARPQGLWRAERTRQYVSTTKARERRWRHFSTFHLSKYRH